MWTIPKSINKDISFFASQLNCEWIGAILVESNSAYDYDDCHNGLETHVSIYGGNIRLGYYFVTGFGDIQAIEHSLWEKHGQVLDIMPYRDGREYNIVGLLPRGSIKKLPNYYFQSLDKYKTQEIDMTYYVYQLVDPRINKPFYIGKGTGNRARTHLWGNPATPNIHKENKIAAIRDAGYEPRIEYIAENIVDEDLAYKIEYEMIKHYGRKGYDKNGILTNICEDNRPPSHKGKTYEEIYGPERAKQQREMRSRLQKERGGYGPKKHSQETRKKFSEINTGSGNPMYGKKQKDSTKRLISEKAKKRVGRLNKTSYAYKLTSPTGTEYVLYGGEAKNFCKDNNLSWSTLKMQIQKSQWSIPKKGKTKGWRLESGCR